MNTVTTDKAIISLAKSAFPDYRGRRFYTVVQQYPIDVRSYWDGGSRDYFALLRIVDKAVHMFPAQSAFDKPVEGLEHVTVPEGWVIVRRSIFCGKETGLTVYTAPNKLA